MQPILAPQLVSSNQDLENRLLQTQGWQETLLSWEKSLLAKEKAVLSRERKLDKGKCICPNCHVHSEGTISQPPAQPSREEVGPVAVNAFQIASSVEVGDIVQSIETAAHQQQLVEEETLQDQGLTTELGGYQYAEDLTEADFALILSCQR
jgi:hypothetical protein